MSYPKEHMWVRPRAYWFAVFSRERREERARQARIAETAHKPQPLRYSVVPKRAYDPIVRNRSKPLRSRIWIAQDRRCYLCDRLITLDMATDEHVVPRSKGGKSRGNILVACGPCNVRKANRQPYPCEVLFLAYINLVVVHRAKPSQRVRPRVQAAPSPDRQTPDPEAASRVEEAAGT